MLVIAFIRHLEVAEGDITDGHIKKAVREVCFLKPLDSNGRFLIELLGDAPADGIQFDAVDLGIHQAIRAHADEVADAAGRLQHIAGLEPHVLQGLIHGPDHHGRGVESSQSGLPCCLVFILG